MPHDTLARKEVRPDEKTFERKGPFEGGRFLEWTEKNSKRESRKDMPQMKGLKKLIVAGQATRKEIWQHLKGTERAEVAAISFLGAGLITYYA